MVTIRHQETNGTTYIIQYQLDDQIINLILELQGSHPIAKLETDTRKNCSSVINSGLTLLWFLLLITVNKIERG